MTNKNIGNMQNKFNSSAYDTFKKSQKRLLKRLSKIGVSSSIINDISQSGYYLLDNGIMFDNSPYVGDSFYGSKIHPGLMPFPEFLASINGKVPYKPHPHIHKIRNVQEALDLLASNDWYVGSRMSFRGQNQEYFMRRRFPNQIEVLDGGRERLIIPGYWRKYRNNWDDRFYAKEYRSLFRSIYGDFLTYYGLPKPDWIAKYNIKKYGFHNMSDMEELDEDFNKEYYKRWMNTKILENADLPVIEQHYGVETPYLDVTFDLRIALFFATHRYNVENGKAFYSEIPKGGHQGVVYSFVFHNPSVTYSKDLVKEISCFDHIPPTRPLKQNCALRLFDQYAINEAVTDIDTIFYLSPDFDTTGIATFEELFPSAEEDKFYKALIDIYKEQEHGDTGSLSGFPIYRDL